MGKILIIIGVILIIVGVIVHFFQGIPFLGKLPGDFHIKRENFSFYFPLASSILVSILLSLVLYLINKYLKYLADGGEYVIGNFSHLNPTKRLMEVLSDWYLHHRTKYDLIRMAVEAEANEDNVKVDMEELGINLFLRIRNSVNGHSAK